MRANILQNLQLHTVNLRKNNRDTLFRTYQRRGIVVPLYPLQAMPLFQERLLRLCT